MSDGKGGLVAATQTFTLAAVNDAPVLTAPTAITYTDTAFVDNFATMGGTLVANDVDSSTLTYGI